MDADGISLEVILFFAGIYLNLTGQGGSTMKTGKIGFVLAVYLSCSMISSIAVASVNDDQVTSQKIREADGTSGQNTNSGSGVKTGHIQDGAVTARKVGFLKNVIIVAPQGGDFVEPRTAVASITDASATNPYVVKVMPGQYQAGFIEMKPYIELQGSGIDVTILTGHITTASNSKVSQLTLMNIPLYHAINVLENTTLDHVKVVKADSGYIVVIDGLDNGFNNNFIDCYFEGPDEGIAVVDGAFNLKGTTVVTGSNALRLDGGRGGTINIENSVLQSNTAAIYANLKIHRVNIKNSMISGLSVFASTIYGDSFYLNIAHSQINADYSMLRPGYDKMIGCYGPNFDILPNLQ